MRLPPLRLLEFPQKPGPLFKRALQADIRPCAGQLAGRGRASEFAALTARALLPALRLLRLALLPELLQVVDGVEQALAVAQGPNTHLHLQHWWGGVRPDLRKIRLGLTGSTACRGQARQSGQPRGSFNWPGRAPQEAFAASQRCAVRTLPLQARPDLLVPARPRAPPPDPAALRATPGTPLTATPPHLELLIAQLEQDRPGHRVVHKPAAVLPQADKLKPVADLGNLRQRVGRERHGGKSRTRRTRLHAPRSMPSRRSVCVEGDGHRRRLPSSG